MDVYCGLGVCIMRFNLILAFVVLGFSSATASAKARMYCYQNVLTSGATGGGLVHVNGFTIEVKPSPNSDPDLPEESACHATIRSSAGKIIFEHYDWGIEIDPITGKDVNGDGQPDAVLSTFSGGAHCCSTYYVISLGKTPGLIRQFGNRFNASFEDLKKDGQVEILISEEAFDEGFGLDHAFSPFPQLIVRLKGAKFEDISATFWPVFEKEIAEIRGKLKPDSLREFLQSNPTEISDDEDQIQTKSDVLMIALDYLYAGRTGEARQALAEMWPVTSQRKTWDEMTNGYCSGARAQLDISCPNIF